MRKNLLFICLLSFALSLFFVDCKPKNDPVTPDNPSDEYPDADMVAAMNFADSICRYCTSDQEVWNAFRKAGLYMGEFGWLSSKQASETFDAVSEQEEEGDYPLTAEQANAIGIVYDYHCEKNNGYDIITCYVRRYCSDASYFQPYVTAATKHLIQLSSGLDMGVEFLNFTSDDDEGVDSFESDSLYEGLLSRINWNSFGFLSAFAKDFNESYSIEAYTFFGTSVLIYESEFLHCFSPYTVALDEFVMLDIESSYQYSSSTWDDAVDVWRPYTFILSKEEWEYLIFGRPNAANLWARASYNTRNGIFFFPDGAKVPSAFSAVGNASSWDVNGLSYDEGNEIIKNGAIFIPAKGYTDANGILNGYDTDGYCWTRTPSNSGSPYYLHFTSEGDITVEFDTTTISASCKMTDIPFGKIPYEVK